MTVALKKLIIDYIEEKYPGGMMGFIASVVIASIVIITVLVGVSVSSVLGIGNLQTPTICSAYSENDFSNYTEEELENFSEEEWEQAFADIDAQKSFNETNSYGLASNTLVYPIPQDSGVTSTDTDATAMTVTATEGGTPVVAPANSTVKNVNSTGTSISFEITEGISGIEGNPVSITITYSGLSSDSITVAKGDELAKANKVASVTEDDKEFKVTVVKNIVDTEAEVPEVEEGEEEPAPATKTDTFDVTAASWYGLSKATWVFEVSTAAPGEVVDQINDASNLNGAEVCNFEGSTGVGVVNPGDSAVGSWGGYSNGKIPSTSLMPITSAPGEMLAVPAAVSFNQMNLAFKAEFGYDIPVNDSYRSFEGQVSTALRYGCYPDGYPGRYAYCRAAVPGQSNHGWGLAVDLNGMRYGNAQYVWLTNNGPAFGWKNPPWALQNGSKPEPWHWEYVGDPSAGVGVVAGNQPI